MEWKLFADLADAAGDRRVAVSIPNEATVEDALKALLHERPTLRDRVLDADGELESHINVLVNGRDITGEEGLATRIDEDDELALFPPVSGG